MLSCWFPNLQLRSAARQNAAFLGSLDIYPLCCLFVFFGGGIFSLVYLMFVACKAISFYIKKTSYNWEFIAEKGSSLLRSWSSSRCACITHTYASYVPHSFSSQQFVSFPLFFTEHVCPISPCVVHQRQKFRRFFLLSSLPQQTPERHSEKRRRQGNTANT